MRIKVLMILVSFGPGGAEKRFSQLFKYLVNNSDQDVYIDFLVPRTLIHQLPSLYVKRIGNCIKLIPFGLPYNPTNNLVSSYLLRRFDQLHLALILLIMRVQSKYSVVHFITHSAFRYCKIIKTDCRVWSCFNSENLSNYLKTNRAFKKLASTLTNIDCLSETIAKELKQVNLLKNCFIHSSPCSFIEYRNVITTTKKKILTFSGGIRKYKGIDLLVPALKKCLKTCPKLIVQILGRGDLEGFVRTELKEYISNGRVSIEHVESPPDKLKASMIFVSLQTYENYPSQSLIEAMATSNAIIATDVGLTNLLVNQNTGILINRSVDELVAAIEYLYHHEDVAREMGQAASLLVRSKHTANIFWKYLKNIYLSCPKSLAN